MACLVEWWKAVIACLFDRLRGFLYRFIPSTFHSIISNCFRDIAYIAYALFKLCDICEDVSAIQNGWPWQYFVFVCFAEKYSPIVELRFPRMRHVRLSTVPSIRLRQPLAFEPGSGRDFGFFKPKCLSRCALTFARTVASVLVLRE